MKVCSERLALLSGLAKTSSGTACIVVFSKLVIAGVTESNYQTVFCVISLAHESDCPKVIGSANLAVPTTIRSMPHLEYFYVTLASPCRLYSTRENLFGLPGFEPALKPTEAEALTNRLQPQHHAKLT
jgi:hypothetical protein